MHLTLFLFNDLKWFSNFAVRLLLFFLLNIQLWSFPCLYLTEIVWRFSSQSRSELTDFCSCPVVWMCDFQVYTGFKVEWQYDGNCGRERDRESWWLINYYAFIFSMIETFCVVGYVWMIRPSKSRGKNSTDFRWN